MSRIPITVTAEFKQVVADYKKLMNLKSWNQALLALAALGYEKETGVPPPDPYPGWGGWRGSEESLRALVERVDKMTNFGQNDPAESEEENV